MASPEGAHAGRYRLQSLIHSVFQRPSTGAGLAVGFTAAEPRAGVSYVSRQIADQLRTEGLKPAVYIEAGALQKVNAAGGLQHQKGPAARAANFNTWEDWRSQVSLLRSRARYTIIDCPPLSQGGETLSLAPHLDGMVIVVAANETHKSKILNAERLLGTVDGKILGFVLNKRTYPVPAWLFRFL